MAQSIHIDKLLTNFATRYKAEMDVADFVAPPFKVKRSSDKYLEYNKSSLRIYDNKVSGREPAKEITQDVTSSTYTTEEYSLARFVSHRTRDNADAPQNLEFDATRHLKEAMMIAREKRVIDIAGSASVVTQTSSPSNKWNTESSGTPIADIRSAMATIWQNSTKMANSIVIPADVAIQMVGTDEYRDYFKYDAASSTELFSVVSGLRKLGLVPMISGMFGANTNQGGASDPGIESMWGENVVIFYREATPTLETRTFMYSPFRKKDEMRRIEGSTEKKQRGILFDIYEDIDELLVDATHAYLYTNTLA